MLFPVILFLMVLSPLFIPIGVTVVDAYDTWRSRRTAQPVRQLGQIRPVRQFHPALGLVPAAA
jgi:hypothetical protein